MKIILKSLRYSFLFILIVACSQKPTTEKLEGNSELKLTEIKRLPKEQLSVFDLIPLETTSENLMGLDLRIRTSSEYFFVFDEAIQDCVHQFEKDGRYLGRRAIVGEGPNTLLRLNDFYVSEDGNLEVLNSLGDQAEVFQVGVDNSIRSIFKVDYIPSSFTKLATGDYLFYGGYNLPFVSHRLIRTDSTGLVQEKYLENNYSNKMLPMTERNFFEGNSYLKIIETFNKRGYQFGGSELKPEVTMDFGRYSIPAKFWEMDLLEGGFELIEENGFANLDGYFESEDLTLLSVHIQKPEGIFKNLLFVDKNSGEKRILETSLSGDYLFHYPFGVEENHILFLSYQSVLKKEFGENLSQDLLAKISDQEYDYPVLMKVKISSFK
jgi:hypothetical protein